MKTMARLVSDYLHVLISAHRDSETGDGPLLRRFLDGHDDDAFTELLRRHGAMVLGLALRVVGDRHIAEDVFQATFLVLARKAHSLRRSESLAAWLHGVAFHLALRARKAGARRRQQEARTPSAPPARDPLDELSARELLAVLDEELQRLPEHFRLPLVLCGLEGLSQEEAARRLGWSAGSIKGRLERGRLQLRRLLAKRGLTLPAALAGSVLLGEPAAAVPPALAESARRIALTGSGASPAVLALAAAARSAVLAKLKAAAAVVALIGALSMGLMWWPGSPIPPEVAAAPVVVADQEPAVNEHDTLPKGAVLRLGTLQRRAVGARLALRVDGKTIIGVRGDRYVHVWDAATGLLKERHELQLGELQDMLGYVQSLSPHGRLFAMNEYDSRALHVWDVLTGKALHKLRVQEGDGIGSSGSPATGPSGLHAAAFSRDENLLAALLRTDKDTRLRAWDLTTGKELLDKPIPHKGATDFLTFTPDGKRVVVADNAGLSAYDVADGRRLWFAEKNPFFFFPTWYAFTPDGKILVRGNGILAWDLATGKRVPFKKQPPETWDGALAVTPDGKTLLVGGGPGVLVWDLIQGKEVHTLAGAGEDMFLAPDARSVLTNSGELQRWDLATGKPFYPDTLAHGHTAEVTTLAFAPDGKRLASGSADGSVRWWDAATGKPLHVWRGHEPSRPIRLMGWAKAGVTALDIAPDGGLVVSAGGEETVRVWSAVTGKEVHVIRIPDPLRGAGGRHMPALHVRAGGTRIVAQCAAQGFTGTIAAPPVVDPRPRLTTWDLRTWALLDQVPVSGGAAEFSGDGDFLIADATVTDLVTGQVQARLEKTANEWPEPPYAFSRDGSLIATELARSGKENGVDFIGPAGGAVWETRTGKRVARFPTTSWFGGVAFHPDGRHVAVNDLDGIQILDVTAGKVVAKFTMPERIRAGTTPGSYAGCLAFAPDGTCMATGHPDGSILVWEVKLPQRRPAPLGPGDAEALWADLAHAEAARAWRAVWRLSELPEVALSIIRKQVKPMTPAPDAVMAPLLAELDSDVFDRRETAYVALLKLGVVAEPALRAQLGAKVSLEAKRRIDKLLKHLADAPPPLPPATLQQLRAVAVLAGSQSPEARQILHELAAGVGPAPLTRAARAALGR